MEVVIVAKTHMKNATCVGAFEISSGKNLRLLTSNGDNQPNDTDFEVGQIWNIVYIKRDTLLPPHIEDVLVSSKNRTGFQNNLKSFLLQNALIWRGGPEKIFEGKVKFNVGKSGCITKKGGIPGQSVGFWLANRDLELTILEDQKHYFYFGENGEICAFPLTGYISPTDKIPVGTLIRVSLARWWSPHEGIEKGCYCQISGWYTDNQQNITSTAYAADDDLPF